jgi:hypothetical protein
VERSAPSYGQQAFEVKSITKKEQRLEDENKNLQQIIGKLTIELKKRVFMMKRKKSLSIAKKMYLSWPR